MSSQVRREAGCISRWQTSHTPERLLYGVGCLRGRLHGGGRLLGVLSLVLAGGLRAALRPAVDDRLAVLVHLELHDADLKFEGRMRETIVPKDQGDNAILRVCSIRALWNGVVITATQ